LPIRVCAKGTNPPERTINLAVRPVRRQRPRPARPPRGDRPRLLVVDDEPGILRALARDLDGDFEVVTAGCYAEAERACATQPFDVLLCDVNVQGQSGVDLAARLTSGHAQLAGRTVYMTGGSIDARLQASHEARPERFVAKPFDLPSLVKILKGAATG
jgi:DNA-binding NtrC family response regulator